MELCEKDLKNFYQDLKGVSDYEVGCFLIFKYFIEFFSKISNTQFYFIQQIGVYHNSHLK